MYAFGDYVEANESMDNTARVCSAPCLALHTVGKSTGSWNLWKIDT
jgi:hypothetical protein